MNVLLFGATGMVGQGVLRECLLDPGVDRVLAVGRSSTRQTASKLREVVVPDVANLAGIEGELAGFDACFFCLGVSSIGMRQERYTSLTHDLTLAVARMVARSSPAVTFVYVSGAGTDSSEQGRSMWARVKGKTENDLLRLPFKAAYMFRPGAILPLHGVRSKTRWVRLLYTLAAPIGPTWRALFPNTITTTEQVGRAMLRVVRDGYATRILETRDINRL
ncbi:MAG: NAD(P)H-binding protein [Gemmatimonadales bacterium]